MFFAMVECTLKAFFLTWLMFAAPSSTYLIHTSVAFRLCVGDQSRARTRNDFISELTEGEPSIILLID